MKKKTGTIVICFAAGILTGVCPVSAKESYQSIVEEYKKIFLTMDDVSYQYDCVLAAIGDYVEQKADYSDTTKTVENIIGSLKEEKDNLEDYTLDDEMSDLLEEYGILPEEFEAFGRSQEDEFTDAISDMEELSEYLEYAEDSMDDYDRLVEAYGQYKDIQDYMKGVNYYANFNYWFAEWDEEMTEYVQKEVTPEIKSCISEDFVWENDRDVVERKAMRYMDDLEDYIEVLAKNTGEERERKLELEQELGEQMKK